MATKEVPEHVIIDATSVAPAKMKEEIEQSVRDYVNGNNPYETTKFEGDLEAQSRNPLDFDIEDTGMTFRRLIDIVHEMYNLMIECRSIYNSKNITTGTDCLDIDINDIESDIPAKIVQKIEQNLRELPKGYARGFAMYQNINSPVAGFVVKEIYQDRVKGNLE